MGTWTEDLTPSRAHPHTHSGPGSKMAPRSFSTCPLNRDGEGSKGNPGSANLSTCPAELVGKRRLVQHLARTSFEVMFESKSERMPMVRFCKYYIGRSLFPKFKKRATSISSRCEGVEVMFESKSEMDAP